MNYLFLKDIIDSPWQVDSSTFHNLMPMFRGLFSGMQIEKSIEPENYKPHAYFANTRELMQGYYSDDQSENTEEEPEMEKVVNVLPIRSILTKHDQDCGPRGTRTYASRLLRADKQANVIGHVIVMESGGGQASSVAEMTDAIIKCKKPIVVWIDGMACSAAYYIACYCKEIIASRETDMVGCIGTMAVYSGRKSKSEANMLGEIEVTIIADGAEEKNEEVIKALDEFDFSLVKSHILNPINQKFKDDVTANRAKVTADQLKGRTYFAKDVIGTLIDSVGDFQYAIDRVLELANYKPKQKNGGPSSSQITPKNKVDMKKQFLNVNKVLNVAALEATEEGVFLNEEQLELVENQIASIDTLTSEHQTAIEAVTAELATANETVANITAELTAARTELTNALDPFNAIDPTIASADTPEAKVTAIRTLLSAKPGSAPVQNLGANDKHDDANQEVDWETINNLEYNKQVDANL